jgi:hypothetical protein
MKAEKRKSREAEKQKQESIEPETQEKIQNLPQKKTKINSPPRNNPIQLLGDPMDTMETPHVPPPAARAWPVAIQPAR